MAIKNIFTPLSHIIFLSLAILFAFYWSQNPNLSPYSIQIIGLLILFYFVNYFQNNKTVNKLLDSLIITMVVLLVILTTGGLESPALPLVFILAVFISLMLHPLTAVPIITLIGILLERDSTLKGLSTDTFQIYVWLIIPPIISLISKQYLRLLESQQKIKIIETQEKIAENEVKNIENVISTFSLVALNFLAQNDLKKLQEEIKSLPDKIDEMTAK